MAAVAEDSPSSEKIKQYNSEDSDIASGSSNSKSNPSSNASSNPQPQATKGTGFAEYETANRSRNTLEESTVNEADEILQNFSDSSKEETAEDIAAEAEDIMSGFSGSKESSSSNSDPTEFELGLGNSTSSSDSDQVLMHNLSSDDDGDIGLEELFETAAALDVTLETENTARISGSSPPSQESTASGDFDSMGVESNSSLSCSTIEEEHTESIEAEQTTATPDDADSSDEESGSPNKQKAAAVAALTATGVTAAAVTKKSKKVALSSSPAPRSFQPTIAEAAPSIFSNTRTLLYDTDDEEAGQSEAATPMPWFSAVPYSTGKWKKTEDGMSVVSDDISVSGGAPVLPGNHHLPYTVQNKNYEEPLPPPSRFQRKHWILVAIGVVLLLIAAILLGVYASNNDPEPPTTVVKDTEFIDVATVPPTEVVTSIEEDVVEEDTPTIPPTLAETTDTTIPITTATTVEDVLEYEAQTVLTGLQGGDQFGSVVSMTSNGKYLATLSNSNSNPVRAFVKDGDAWFPLPDIPLAERPKYTPSSGDGSSVATALTDNGDLVVAVSSFAMIEVYTYVGGFWTRKGELLYWEQPRGISHISMDLSADASTLAIGLVDAPGTTIKVSVFEYEDYYETWGDAVKIDPLAHRDANQRSVKPEEGTILAIDLELSGDGNVLAIAEWDVGSPEVIVQTFEKDYDEWFPMGEPMQFLHGPVSMALGYFGYRFAVVAEHPGKGTIFDWNGKRWAPFGSNGMGFLPGGSSVAMALEGTRILIGDAGPCSVKVYDFDEDYTMYYSTEEWSSWKESVSLAGAEQGGYGTSVAMNEMGSVLGIGAPTSGSFNSGQVTMYGTI